MSMRFEDFSVMTDGLVFPESPVVLEDGSVLVPQVMRGSIVRVMPDGKKVDVAEVGYGPNGIAMGPDGALYIVNNGQKGPPPGVSLPPGALERALQRVNMPKPAGAHAPGEGFVQKLDINTGKFETLYESSAASRMWAPNDLIFDAHGGMWFTDHGRDNETGRHYGGILYAKADGSHIERMDIAFVSPNGIGLSPDGKTLYVADTFLCRLWALDIVAPGKLGPPPPLMPAKVVQTLPGYQLIDSLKVEDGGKICIGTVAGGGITIVDPDGSIEFIAFPNDLFVTNVCFGGKDMRDIYAVGSSGNLYKGRWPRAGLKLNYNPY